MTLNPALADARFCPRCGRGAEVRYPRSLTCAHCGYGAFYNPKPVAGTVVWTEAGELILLRRGFEPGKGLWTFPGGFVDLGESVEDAARREAREEIGVDVELGGLIGVYSRPDDRIVLIVFHARLPDGTRPQTSAEAVEVQAVAPGDVPWDLLAFWSTAAALRDAIAAPPPAARTPGG